jgi:hypothetical protein
VPDNPASAALEEIREREQAATRGPWWFDEDDLMWRLHGVHAVMPPFMEGFPEQVLNHQILKAPKQGTPYAEYWPCPADASFIVAARSDVPRLLKALEAALSFHQPRQLYGMVEDFKGNVICGHGQDYDGDLHFEGDDGLWYCKDKPTVTVCATCCDGPSGDLMAEWECPTYKAILAALTGEANRG